MILFPEFYRKYMVRKLSSIYTPKPIIDNTIEFPKNSTIYQYTLNNTSEFITKDSFLTVNRDILVKTIDKYNGELLGVFRPLVAEIRPYIIESSKNETKINFIKNNVAILRSNTIMVKNFLGLNKFYKYAANPLLDYWRTNNLINTIVFEINKELEREIFIPIEIDTELHYTKFIEFMDRKITSGLLRNLPSNNVLLMFEIWKLFFKDRKESSLFNNIKPEKFKKVNLMFHIGNRTVIINFAVLLNVSASREELSLESAIPMLNSIFTEEVVSESIEELKFEMDMYYKEESDKFTFNTEEDLTNESGVLKKLNKLPEKVIGKLLYIMCNKLKASAIEISSNISGEAKDTKIFKVLTKEEPTETVIPVAPTKTKNQGLTKKSVDDNIIATKEEPEDNSEIEIDNVADKTLDEILDAFGEDVEDIEEEKTNIEFTEEDVDDNINSSDINSNIENDYNIEEDINGVPKIGDKILTKINNLQENKIITKGKAAKLIEAFENNRNRKLLVNGKPVKISDIVDEELSHDVDSKDISIVESKVVTDKETLKNTSIANMKNYLKNNHEKLLIKTLMSIENTNFIVSNIEIKTNESILGSSNEYKVELIGLDGNKSSFPIIMPNIDKEEGTYKLSKNTYIMRKQRNDLPIRKISHNEVSLNSDYGKLFITRGANKSNDRGYWLRNQLLKLYNNDVISNYVTNINVLEIEDVKLPEDYTLIAKYIKLFNYQDYVFNFDYYTRDKDVPIELKEILEEDGVIVGKRKNNYIVLRYDNILYEYKKDEFEEIGSIYELLDIVDNSPYETITIKIFKTQVPLILLLGYYYGIEKLLEHYKIEYYYDDTKSRIDSNKYLVIKLSEDRLVIERTKITDILFSGLLTLKENSMFLRRLNSKNDFDIIFNLMEYSLLVRNEVSNLDELFISPVTFELLKILKLPLTFRGLLFKAVDMLEDDSYKNPKAITDTVFKGYDRFSSMMYKEISLALREQRNKSEFSKATVTLNPYNVIKKLNEDSTTLLVNDLNPISALKQYEDVTYLGSGGRSKESLSRKTRGYDDDDIGILSEANKDSGDVGITSFLTASPSIVNSLGLLENVDVGENTSWAQLLSTSAMLAPFAINDDTKRLVFSGIQNEHVVPTINMDIPYVRTGYETLIANRLSSKFAIISKGDGIVKLVDKNKVIVKYKDEEKDTTYKLGSWYTKVESNTCYKHTMVANVTNGDKISKDFVIGYINTFFTPDPYDKTRVIYLQHRICRMAFMEDLTTYEDSTAMSKEFSKKMEIENIKIGNTVCEATDNVVTIVKIGEKVIPEQAMLTLSNQFVDMSDLSQDEIDLINDTNNSTLRAKYNGTVDNIEVLYNCELEDMSESLRALAIASDKKLKETTGFTGRVNASYSIKGTPMEVGSVEVKIYVSILDDMGIADKAIYGNQLKCTVGDIFYKIISYDDKKPVDATFSTTSFEKRITPSLPKMGLLSSGAKHIEEKALAIYFGS